MSEITEIIALVIGYIVMAGIGLFAITFEALNLWLDWVGDREEGK